jgi:Protein of unknown function (DUF3489)
MQSANLSKQRILICVLPGCGSEFEESDGYIFGRHPGKYCSNDCVNEAFMLKKDGKEFALPQKEIKKTEDKNVQLPADDFGESGVVRRFCDKPTCRRPVTLEWRSRSGKIYCSNECLKTEKPEKESRQMTTENTEDSPIAPAAAKKKAAKKVAAKKVAAKTKETAKAAKKAAKKTSAKAAKGEPREGSKTAQVVEMLKSKGGTTIDVLCEKFGWQEHTTRALLSAGGAITKKFGMIVTSKTVGDKRIYRIE